MKISHIQSQLKEGMEISEEIKIGKKKYLISGVTFEFDSVGKATVYLVAEPVKVATGNVVIGSGRTKK